MNINRLFSKTSTFFTDPNAFRLVQFHTQQRMSTVNFLTLFRCS